MRAVSIRRGLLDTMRHHGRATYPDECCGFLIGLPDPSSPESPRSVVGVERTPNEFEGVRRRRFLIRAEELRSAERRLEGLDRVIAGFYHSHPDHPAQPSSFDQEHAWPGYTYLVLSVTATESRAVGAFELEPDAGRFEQVPLFVTAGDGPQVPESLRVSGAR